MIDQPAIERIDHNDARVLAATEAEQRLFEHYGLEQKAHYIEIEEPGIRVRVLEVGSGPSVLMVPGGSGNAFEFIPLMAELKGWRLLAVNRPGGGMSDAVDHRQVDLRRLAVDTLTAVLDAFGLERLPVIGTSIGGLWTFWLALDRPERVSMMVQVGGTAMLNANPPLPMRLLSVPLVNRLIFHATLPSSPEKARNEFRMLGSSREITQAWPDVLPETSYRMEHLPTFRTAWLSLFEALLTPRGIKRRYQLGPDELSRVAQAVMFIWGDGVVAP